MKKAIRFLVICFLMARPAYGQGLQYGGMQQLSLTFGQSGSTSGLAIVNGIRFHRFFAGLGADARFTRTYHSWSDYGGNTSAFYADGRYYINRQMNLFAKLDGGINVINQKMTSSPSYSFNKRVGYYSAMGLGFKARIGKELFYSFDVSYCMRQTRYNHTYNTFLGWQTDYFDIRQYMILVCLGLEIF